MSAAVERATTSKEPEAGLHENISSLPIAEQASESDGGLFSRAFSGAPGEPPVDGATRLLGNPIFSHSANNGQRVIALKRAQQTHGNRFAQRVVTKIQRKPRSTKIIQRECACGGTCAKCSPSQTNFQTTELPISSEPPRLIQAQAASDSTGPAAEKTEQELIPKESHGQPLDERTRGFMESRFYNDFSDVRVHTDSSASASAQSLNADAYTVGRDIYFAEGKYVPTTTSGQHLLAHELTHTVQQQDNTGVASQTNLSVSDAYDPYEQEADRAADRVVHGTPVTAPAKLSPTNGGRPLNPALRMLAHQGSRSRGVQRQEGETPATVSSTSEMPPRAGISVSMTGIMFLPAAGATFHAGLKAPQGLAIALYKLLGDQFQANHVEALLDRVTPAGWGGIGTLAGDAAGGEPIEEFGIPLMESLFIIGWIHAQHLENRLSQGQRDLLRFGMFASRAWNDINRTYASELSDITLPPWFTEDLFRQELASRIELLRRYIDAYVANEAEPSADSRQEIVNVLQDILSAVEFNAAMLETIRGDSALISHSVYQLLWPPPRPEGLAPGTEPPAAMAEANRAPVQFFASSFMAFMNIQSSLVTEAWTDPDGRRELMDRFERYSTRTMLQGSAGDQQVTETPATANAAALPSQMGVSPPLSGPPGGAQFEGSATANYRFVMSIQFPDVFTAFTNFYYEWNYVRVPDDMIGRPVNFDDLDPQSPDYGAVAARSFRRAGQYAVEDVETVFRELGPAGVGALNLVSANAILRFVGTGIRLLFGYFTRPASETDVAFPGVGVYMMRAKAIPYQGENPEMVRPPSVAFQPVIIRDPTELVEDRVRQDVAIAQRDYDRMQELMGILSEPASHMGEEDMRHELDVLERSLSSVGGSLEVQREQLVKYRDSQREGSRERADAERQLERLDQIIAVRANRAEDHNLTGAEPLIASFVNDDGQNIRLTMEAVREPSSEGSSTYWVSDLTTPNSSQNRGTGEDRPAAIMNAVENILRGQGGYGRGHVAVHIDGHNYTRRITASLGSLFMEAIENVTTALSLAAVVAAPFTGGATLVLLLPIGAIGAIPSAYRLINRGIDGTLRFDLDTVMDIVNIVGGVIGLAHAATPLRMVQAGRVLYIMGLGTDALGVLMIPAGIMVQIDQLGDLPPGERAARIMEILGQAMLNVGIMIGGSLAQRARQQHMESGAAPHIGEPLTTPDGHRLTTPDPLESRQSHPNTPSAHPATDPSASPTRTGNPDAPSLRQGIASDGVTRIRLTEEGRLVVCGSPCTFLEDMFPNELGRDRNLRAEFDRIRADIEEQMLRQPVDRDMRRLNELYQDTLRLWDDLDAAQLAYNRTLMPSTVEFPGHRDTLDNIQAALSHIDPAVPDLARSRAHLAEVINDVARLQTQGGQIAGLEGWLERARGSAERVATAGRRDQSNPDERRKTQDAARDVAALVSELYEARRLAQEYGGQPDITIRIGQDGVVRDPVTGKSLKSFDISVERRLAGGGAELLRRIEVESPVGVVGRGRDLISGIAHAAEKIPRGVRDGTAAVPPGTREGTIAVQWPPPPVRLGGDAQMIFQPDGSYRRVSVADPTIERGPKGNLLDDMVLDMNGKVYENPVEYVHSGTVIDQNGRALFSLKNETPGVAPARWTWKRL